MRHIWKFCELLEIKEDKRPRESGAAIFDIFFLFLWISQFWRGSQRNQKTNQKINQVCYNKCVDEFIGIGVIVEVRKFRELNIFWEVMGEKKVEKIEKVHMSCNSKKSTKPVMWETQDKSNETESQSKAKPKEPHKSTKSDGSEKLEKLKNSENIFKLDLPENQRR